MQRFLKCAIVAFACSFCLHGASAPSSGNTIAYTIQPFPGSDFSVDIEKTGILKGKHHAVHFEKYSADLQYDIDHPTDSKILFIVRADSMTDTDDWLEEKNRHRVIDYGENKMIEVSRYPKIIFVSRMAVESAPGEYNVIGELTIHGVTRTEKLTIKTEQTVDGVFHFTGQAYVNMREFGMEPPSTMLGAVGTKEEMFVHFRLEARPSTGLAR